VTRTPNNYTCCQQIGSGATWHFVECDNYCTACDEGVVFTQVQHEAFDRDVTQLQRCDTCNVYVTDEDAADAVRVRWGAIDMMTKRDRINAMCIVADRLSRTLRVHRSDRKAADPVWLRRAHVTLIRLAGEARAAAGEEPKAESGQS
jgi:hypothetical protein